MSHYSSSKYGGSSGSSYYSRSRDSERGRERDSDWGRDSWRRNERDRSRDNKDSRQRSPARETYFSEYNRERRGAQDKYHPSEEPTSRYPKFTRFERKYNQRGYQGQGANFPTTTLIREKDLINNAKLSEHLQGGYGNNHYESYHYPTQGNYSEFHGAANEAEHQRSTVKEKDPKDDPLFKSAVDTCIGNMKTRGEYDQVRRECLSDIDTKAAFINLRARVKNTVDKYLNLQVFKKDLDKVKTREGMRKKILDTPYFDKGIESLVNQILTPKINSLIRPKIEDEVYASLKIDKSQKTENNSCPLPNMSIPPPSFPVGFGNHHAHFVALGVIPPTSTTFDQNLSIPPPPPPPNPPNIGLPPTPTSFDQSISLPPPPPNPPNIGLPPPAPSLYDQTHPLPPLPPNPPNIVLPPPTPSSYDQTHSLPPLPPNPPNIALPPPTPSSYDQTHSLPPLPPNPPNIALPPAPSVFDKSISLPPLPLSLNPTIPPPPLPPLPPMNTEVPPPPPSPPKTQIPPPPPAMDDEACSSPPPPVENCKGNTSRASTLTPYCPLSNDLSSSQDNEEPLPPGEEPDTYFHQMRLNLLSHIKSVDMADIPLPDDPKEELPSSPVPTTPEPERDSVDEKEEMEDVEEEEEAEDEEEDSEEESPMFEKIGEVSPPRPVELHNPELVKELSKELFKDGDGFTSETVERDIAAQFESEGRKADAECKFLESIPMYEYKVSYYKRIPDS